MRYLKKEQIFALAGMTALMLLACLVGAYLPTVIARLSNAPTGEREVVRGALTASQGGAAQAGAPTAVVNIPTIELPVALATFTSEIITPRAMPTEEPPVLVVTRVTPTAQPTPVAAPPFSADVTIQVDTQQNRHPISPLIYGVSRAPAWIIPDLNPTGQSWGGNNSSRYNWRAGNLWNAAHDYIFVNGTYGQEGMVADQFLRESATHDLAVRLTIPTLGWVAKDAWSCSFRDENGECYNPTPQINCNNPLIIADPYTTSIRSTPQDIREWMQHIRDSNLPIRFAAMDNEPELWGNSHYDVHPDCTTYAEIRDQFLTYSAVVKEVLPEVETVGPVSCCWHFYWESAAGHADKAQHGNQDFIPWFLDQMRLHEEQTGQRLLDVLDIHYYPEDLYAEVQDGAEPAERQAWRMRATRSLWDPTYIDETWIDEAVYILPRMQQLIDEHYPGTKLGLSEWNYGADDTMNGALALAEALGIFGRYDLYYAYYWQYPEPNSPGYYAFKLYTNFDGQGNGFGSESISAESSDHTSVGAHAALNPETGDLHLMLINKNPDRAQNVAIDLQNFSARQDASLFYYDGSSTGIGYQPLVTYEDTVQLVLPPYTIYHLVLPAKQ